MSMRTGIYTQIHSQNPSSVVSVANLFCTGSFYLPLLLFVLQSLNEGQYIREGGVHTDFCCSEEHQRPILPIRAPMRAQRKVSMKDNTKNNEMNQSDSCQKGESSFLLNRRFQETSRWGYGQQGLVQNTCHNPPTGTGTTSELITPNGGSNERAGLVWPQSAASDPNIWHLHCPQCRAQICPPHVQLTHSFTIRSPNCSTGHTF